MTYLMAVFMGLIQGVAEFLPISSSGHLALFQTFFGMEDVESRYMLFSVLLHFGTLLSVCVVYWRDVLEMIREFFLGLAALAGRKERQETPPAARRLVMLIVVAQLLVAYLIELLGLFGTEKQPLEVRKMVGMGVAIAGIIIFKWT